jgi:hypothetical protein
MFMSNGTSGWGEVLKIIEKVYVEWNLGLGRSIKDNRKGLRRMEPRVGEK